MAMITQYCHLHNYGKERNSIPHPLICNRLSDIDQIKEFEIKVIEPIANDFQQLKEMIQACKAVGCEPMY